MPRTANRLPGLKDVVAKLQDFYGKQPRPLATDVLGLAILESCAYLVDDDRRREVFLALKKKTGLVPQVLLHAPADDLLAALKPGGILSEMRLEKLRTCAEIALDVGPEKLRSIRRLPPNEARKILKRFPGIADAGADKILLLCRAQRSLAPDSNALRVLVRVGFGQENSNYGKKYRSAAKAVAPELPDDFDWLMSAHQLLRRHGLETCKTSEPRCTVCPLRRACAWYRNSVGLARPRPRG